MSSVRRFIARLWEFDYWPLTPILALLVLYELFMPAAPPVTVSFAELPWHQQLIGGAAFPLTLVSLHFFLKVNDLGQQGKPAE